MKLLFHIARKDAARIRWFWLAWIGVLVGKIGVGVAFEHGLQMYRGYSLWENLHGGLVAIDLVATYLLASWLVMEDAPMRANHYARTRPVSRGGLLAAKALGSFVLLGLAPVLVWLPWWIYCDFSVPDCLRETALTLAVQGLVIMPAFLLGSLVDSHRRLLLWTPVWMGALFVAFFIPIMMLAAQEETRGLLKDPEQLGLWQTRFLVAGGGLLLTCVGLIFWQTLRRRPLETVAVLTATWAVATAWVCGSSLNFWPREGEWAEHHPENARGVEVRLASATTVPSPDPDSPFDYLSLHWQTTARPGLAIIPLQIRDTFRIGEESKTPLYSRSYHSGEAEAASRFLQNIDFSAMPRRPDNVEVDGRMARSRDHHYLSGIRHETGFRRMTWRHDLPEGITNSVTVLRSEMRLAQIEYEMLGLVRLEKSNRHLNHARSLRITQIRRDTNWASINGVARSPRALPFHPLINFFAPLENHRAEESLTNDGIALVDSWNRRELPIQDLKWLKRGSVVIGGVSLRTFGFQADPGNLWRNGQWLIRETVTDEWFNGLRLAFMTQRETARFYREIVVDPLPITREDGAARN